MIDPGPQFEYFRELGHSISREIPIYLDAEEKLEAFANIFLFDDGQQVLMFHVRMFAPMSARMYRDFKRAIPTMLEQAKGTPVYTFFDVDSDAQGKFAMNLGWKCLGPIDMYDRPRRIYKYDKHLRKE